MNETHEPSKFFRIAGAVIFGLILGFAGIELGVRILKRDIAFQPDPEVFRSLRPDVTRKVYSFDTPEVLRDLPEELPEFPPFRGLDHTNNVGLRMNEPVYEKAAGEKRILFLGDSYTEADGVLPEERFYYLVNQALASTTFPDGTMWRVLNGGIQNGSPAQYVLQLKKFLPALKPDLVLAFIAPNEFADDFFFENRFGLELDEAGNPAAPRASFRLWLLKHFWSLRYFDVLAQQKLQWLDRILWPKQLARDSVGDLFHFYCQTDPVAEEWFGEKTARYIKTMKELTEASGARFGVVLVHYMHIFQSMEPTYREYRLEQYEKTKALRCEEDKAAKYRAAMGELFDAQSIPYWDPYNGLRAAKLTAPEVKLWNYRDYHFSPAGHKVMAEEILKFFSTVR